MNKKIKIPLILVLFLLGIVYFIWLELTGFAIPCIFRKVTGYLCPGCGVTGMLVSLIKLNLRDAYHANSFLFVTSPLLALELLYYAVQRKYRRRLPVWNEWLLILYAVALCVFGVWRNL